MSAYFVAWMSLRESRVVTDVLTALLFYDFSTFFHVACSRLGQWGRSKLKQARDERDERDLVKKNK